MRDTLRMLCDDFIINRDILKRTFSFASMYLLPVCASVFGAKGVRADAEKLKECRALLKKNTGIFSSFRGNIELPVITSLAVSDNAEKQMRKMTEIYAVLKNYFSGGEHLAYTASVLADVAQTHEADSLAACGKDIYKLMRKEHPMLTSSEDSVFALLMAFSQKNSEELISDTEKCYEMLKKKFSDRNSLQSLSHVIALAGGDIEANSQKVSDIYDALKNAGRKYSKYYELAALGALAILPVDINTAVEDILQVDNFLSQQKGYGFWGFDKKTRLMHAVTLVCNDYCSSSDVCTAAITGTLAMIAAQQAATCAAIAASVAAANAASST